MQTYRGNWSDRLVRCRNSQGTMAAHAPHTLHRIHTNASPPWNPLFLSRRIHEYEARALTEERIDGPLNNRWRPQRKRERERSRRPSGPHKTPRPREYVEDDAICGGLKPGERRRWIWHWFMRQKKKNISIVVLICSKYLFFKFNIPSVNGFR